MSGVDVAIIVNNNGMGHLKRALFFSRLIVSCDKSVKIYCDPIKLFKLVNSGDKNNIREGMLFFERFIPFLSYFEVIKQDRFGFDLPDSIMDISHVITDNCLEVLRVRSDAIIAGHFLWHISYSGFCSKFFKNESAKIIENRQPLILGYEVFAGQFLRSYSNFKNIAMPGIGNTYGESKAAQILLSEATVLISSGLGIKGSWLVSDWLLCNTMFPCSDFFSKFKKVFVSPEVFKVANFPCHPNVFLADFSPSMLDEIDLAIIRPGVGTVSDLLCRRSFVIGVYDSEELEFYDTMRWLVDNGRGLRVTNRMEFELAMQTICKSGISLGEPYRDINNTFDFRELFDG